MSAAIVAAGLASIFIAAFVSHYLARRRREAERHEPPIPEFRPLVSEAKIARRLFIENIKWEIEQK